ncbi:hypothetical protein TcCL_Unassigned01245 [Trypanosoma cruzi]|nr:hypothetical protein TcCL_Unassigned01245 [Trypanosoma cruzi]
MRLHATCAAWPGGIACSKEYGSPIHSTTSHQSAETSHRIADAPSDILNCPTQSLRRAMELIRQRRSTVVRRNTDISALSRPHKEGERCGLKMWAPSTWKQRMPLAGNFQRFFFLPQARTADEQGELCGLVDGNIRCSAIDPTAAHQDAAVHAGNESNPAGNGDYGVTKNSVAIGTKQARP